MTYSDKVQASIANTHETAIANKILDMMRDLKLKNDNTTACRWIWELIQNAKDVVNSEGLINIEIDFNEEKKYLSFKHDGKCFTTDNIVHLISQVSSKDRKQSMDNGVTGKFGTGFLTTHLLSERVFIEAFLKDKDESLKKVNILLDRSGETKEDVITSVKKSFEQLGASKEVEEVDVKKQNSFNTSFLYQLDDNGVEIAKTGLDSLYISVPYVFAFLEEINSIRINNLLYIERGNKYVYDNMSIYTINNVENGEKKYYQVLRYNKDKVDLAIPVILKDNAIIVREYPEKIPKLFCDFPLIGTDSFSFPVIINSPRFNPNEPRNGIYLTDKEDKIIIENKNLMLQALDMYKVLLECAESNKWDHVYNIVCVSTQPHKDWISRDWFKKNIIEKCKEYVKQAEIIDTVIGKRKSLFDFFDEQDVFIIGDSEQLIREHVWKLAKSIYSEHLVVFSEIHKWYCSLWSECRSFNIHKLIDVVENFEFIDVLEEKLHDISVTDWLNSLYEVIDLLNNKENYKASKIYPNQLGKLCSLEDLYIDDGIEEIYKEILALLDNNCKERLLDNKIILPNKDVCKIYDYNKLFKEIREALDNDTFYCREALQNLIVLYNDETENNSEQKDLKKFLVTIFKDEIPEDCKVKKVDKDIMEKVKNYWCTEIANEVSICGSVQKLENRLNLSGDNYAWPWIKSFIEYLSNYKHKNLFERKKNPILPNQNGKFITMETLFLDSGEIDELFKDILLETGNDIRNILLPVDIYFELPDSREKGLNDVSQVVIEYVKDKQGKMKNQDATVRDYFNKLTLWISDNPDKAILYFKEIVEHRHWLYNDEEIAVNIKKAEKYDNLLKQYNIEDANDLENVLKSYSKETTNVPNEEIEISEELLIQYGISNSEDFLKAKELNVFKENFVHFSESDESKFIYVRSILERSKNAVFKHLAVLEEYDVSDPVEISNTIFIIKKNGKEMVLITRPSDYGQVILYYESEKDILDFEKDYELWVEDGKTKPQQITFGKMLKLTGINRIPLRKVR